VFLWPEFAHDQKSGQSIQKNGIISGTIEQGIIGVRATFLNENNETVSLNNLLCMQYFDLVAITTNHFEKEDN